MSTPFIQIINKKTSEKLSVYEDGTVFGTERGSKLFILNDYAIDKIKSIINENMYMFKKLTYYNENKNAFILKVNDTSRKHRPIKVVGWGQMNKIMNIILDKNNCKKIF